MTSLVIATRNPGKVREIREILAGFPELEIVSLEALGIEETPEEDALEVFDTFQENALAKARHFARLTAHLTLAEDSGICVDALGGAPGVRSRRFAPGPDQRGAAQDQANNDHLLQQLAGMPESGRGARYVCAAALVGGEGEEAVFLGTCTGVVLEEPRGTGGFGYDPLFYIPSERCTFGELAPERKNEISHRGRAVRQAAEALRANAQG
jgi:XTP/dITP diphosphohydrolase